MTLQQIFYKVVKGMLEQGRLGQRDGTNKYKNNKQGLSCSIGQLIPCDVYKKYARKIEGEPLIYSETKNRFKFKGMDLNKSVVECLRESGVIGQELNEQKLLLLKALQDWHDCNEENFDQWKNEFRAIGRKFKLDTKFIKNIKQKEMV